MDCFVSATVKTYLIWYLHTDQRNLFNVGATDQRN